MRRSTGDEGTHFHDEGGFLGRHRVLQTLCGGHRDKGILGALLDVQLHAIPRVAVMLDLKPHALDQRFLEQVDQNTVGLIVAALIAVRAPIVVIGDAQRLGV